MTTVSTMLVVLMSIATAMVVEVAVAADRGLDRGAWAVGFSWVDCEGASSLAAVMAVVMLLVVRSLGRTRELPRRRLLLLLLLLMLAAISTRTTRTIHRRERNSARPRKKPVLVASTEGRKSGGWVRRDDHPVINDHITSDHHLYTEGRHIDRLIPTLTETLAIWY